MVGQVTHDLDQLLDNLTHRRTKGQTDDTRGVTGLPLVTISLAYVLKDYVEEVSSSKEVNEEEGPPDECKGGGVLDFIGIVALFGVLFGSLLDEDEEGRSEPCPHIRKRMLKSEDDISQGSLWRKMSRSVSDTTLRHPRPNLSLPLPSVTSLMQFKKELSFSRRNSRVAHRKSLITTTSPTLPRCHSPISGSPLESPRMSPSQHFAFVPVKRSEERLVGRNEKRLLVFWSPAEGAPLGCHRWKSLMYRGATVPAGWRRVMDGGTNPAARAAPVLGDKFVVGLEWSDFQIVGVLPSTAGDSRAKVRARMQPSRQKEDSCKVGEIREEQEEVEDSNGLVESRRSEISGRVPPQVADRGMPASVGACADLGIQMRRGIQRGRVPGA
uniref:Uncharacterized protein n=1 Tax=Timema genevievae TaxID=629358 RepID=A0A7R9K7F5_TIMGE|nr:unnamed protein product [Timema genevievae]